MVSANTLCKSVLNVKNTVMCFDVYMCCVYKYIYDKKMYCFVFGP